MAITLDITATDNSRPESETLPADWQARPAAAKLEHIWERLVLPSEYATFPAHDWRFPRLSKRYLSESFDHVSDEMPRGHVRVLHQKGVVAQAEWRAVGESSYTGLFEGVQAALVRLSLGAAPSWSTGFIPGMGVKLFVDGHPSANLQVLNSVDGQGENHDFFALPLTNRIPPAKGIGTRIGAFLFSRVKADPFDLPVDHLARVTEDGTAVQRPVFPAQLFFVPGRAVTGRIRPNSKADFREDLSRIRAGTILYQVHAVGRDGDRLHVADLITRSRFVASFWGDESLFFQHNTGR